MNRITKENDEMGLLYESIYDGYVDDKKDDKEDSDEKDSSDSEDSNKEDSDSKSDNDKEKDSDNDSDDEASDKKDDKEDSGESSVTRSTQSKLKNLTRQFNDVIISCVETHASDCVEKAIDECGGSIGADIHTVIDTALCYLKCKVLEDLGLMKEEEGNDNNEENNEEQDEGEESEGSETSGEEGAKEEDQSTQNTPEPTVTVVAAEPVMRKESYKVGLFQEKVNKIKRRKEDREKMPHVPHKMDPVKGKGKGREKFDWRKAAEDNA